MDPLGVLMKLSAKKFFSLISGRARARKIYWSELRALVQTEQNEIEGLFDKKWYISTYPDIKKSNLDPLEHYINHGASENRRPGPNFDGEYYLDLYRDVKPSEINPLVHYLRHGKSEGRAPNPRATSTSASLIRHVIVKEISIRPGNEIAVLVAHANSGRLKPHVLPYIEKLQESGLSVLLIAVVNQPLELLEREIATADGIIVRDNAGYDFGAWAHGLQLCPALFGASLLIMTNDSVVPTADKTVFRAMIDRVRECSTDIVGLTASHEYGWHIQSYFVAMKPKALASWGFQHFIRNLKYTNDKDEVIREYEIPFATRMISAGLTVSAIFSGTFSSNPTLFSWRDLINQGFPFIKLLILRKKFSTHADHGEALQELRKDWPAVLKNAGFNIDLVYSAIRAADLDSSIPIGSNPELLIDAKKYNEISNDHSLRVSYFGPWNYDNGLGTASREMLCALRHAGVQLNAYPIEKPFHIHKMICPAIATSDFNAQPDLAIVHLNPDSWHLLTAEQHELIRQAKRRIGYWVWETDRLPPAWKTNLNMVDRIWAPSAYCAEVFSSETHVPVDVVPHPVRVPTRSASNRNDVWRSFGIDPQLRVILYIFDGASYLIRKNPSALIRAFAKSGLAEHGWTLVLKTKHLHDRPEAGRDLISLAERTRGVEILEVALHADEVADLLAAADIYASPHCSEGFGLTVAEAMSLGKPVVATDFAGTRDFLNVDCGYPVASHPWTLEEDHGHYLAGHTWAKVDEDALATILTKAASHVAAGDTAMGMAARETIARQLSYEAVAGLINASFADAIADCSRSTADTVRRGAIEKLPDIPQYKIQLANAKRFKQFRCIDGIVPISLNADLSWIAEELPNGSDDDWIIFAPGNACIPEEIREVILDAADSRPDVVLFYADDVASDEDMLERICLKPDYNQTLMVAQDYIGAPVIVRRKTLANVGGIDSTKNTAALYDLVLRVAEAGGSIARIPHVLIGYDGKRPIASVADRRAALAGRRLIANVELADGATPGLLIQRRRFDEIGYPRVSIVIPTRRTCRPGSSQAYIEGLLSSIAKVAWPMDHITVIVGDDVIGEPKSWDGDRWPFELQRIETPRESGEPFNYAAKMNRLWRTARDEHIIFMNDDVTPRGFDWLAALVGFANDQSVGGVGARLHYEDGSLQHSGIIPMAGAVAHAWLGWPCDVRTYQDWAVTQREWSMVTGAVFATRRSLLDQVNGFDERFSLEFNDIDLCLRIRNLGYRIVYNPDAEFTHTEKASRGETIPPGQEVALFLSRWSRWFENDPAYHPAYVPDRCDIVPSYNTDAWYTA